MIAIVDYGLGNLRSICSALDYLGIDFKSTSDSREIKSSDGIILPGVGAFPEGMENLATLGLIALLDDLVLVKKKPILGICLGFQLMATVGYEFRKVPGLGWIDAEVIRFEHEDDNVLIPHVGWNDCNRLIQSRLFTNIPNDALFYFTHSFHMKCINQADVSALSSHGNVFTAAIENSNIFGTQFHPEKSQRYGLEILRNFANVVKVQC